MLDAALIFGVLCAAAAMSYGRVRTFSELFSDPRRRTPFVLLLSAALSLLLEVRSIPFAVPLWLAIDLTAIVAIIWPHWHPHDWPKNDRLVLSFFPPIWVCYLTDGWTGYIASVLLVSLQMIMTLPARQAWDDARRYVNKLRKNGASDMRIAHAC